MKSIAGAEPGSEICHRIRAFKNDEARAPALPNPNPIPCPTCHVRAHLSLGLRCPSRVRQLVSSLLPMPAGCGQAHMFDLEWLGLEHYGDSTWTVASATNVSPTSDCVAIVLVDDSGECCARNTSATNADLSFGTFTAKVARGERQRRTQLYWVEREADLVDAVPAEPASHQPLSSAMPAGSAVRLPLRPGPSPHTQRPNPCNSPCNSSSARMCMANFGESRPQQAIRKKKPKVTSRMAMTLAFLSEGKMHPKPKAIAPAKHGDKKSAQGPVSLVRSSSMKPVLAQKSVVPLVRAASWPRGDVLWEPEGAVLMKEELYRMMDEGQHMPEVPTSKDVFCGAARSPTFIEDLGQDNSEIMEMLQSLNESTHEEDAFDLANCITAEVFGTNPY